MPFSASGEVDILSANLKKIEEYLNQLVSEYEKCYGAYPNQYYIDEVSYMPVGKLDMLKEFIGKYDDATFFKLKFKEASGEVVRILLNILTKPNP